MKRFLLAALALAPLSVSCDSDPKLGLDIQVDQSVSNVAGYELGAFAGSQCAALNLNLGGGLPILGSTARTSFPQGGTTSGLGKLPQGDYALAVVARNADCKVIATGCAEVALDGSKSVNIAVKPLPEGGGVCSFDSQCVNSQCIPKPVAQVGGCNMDVVAYGALDGAIPSASVAVSGPTIVADGSGFKVGYRLIDPEQTFTGNSINSRYGYVQINNSGAIEKRVDFNFDDACENSPMSDGLGFVALGSKLYMVMSVPECAASGRAKGGFKLAEVSNPNAPQLSELLGLGSDGITNAHSVLAPQNALTVFKNRLFTASISSDVGTVLNANWGELNPSTMGYKSDGVGVVSANLTPDTASAVQIAGTDDMIVMMTEKAGLVRMRARKDEAGYYGSGGGTPFVDYSARWGRIAAKGKRAFLLRGLDSGLALSYQDPPAGQTMPYTKTAESDVTLDITLNSDGGAATGGALAVNGSHVFVLGVQSQQGNPAITLATFSGAATKLFQTRKLSITKETNAPAVAGLRDARVAVAANRDRVLVAWLSSSAQSGISVLKKGESLGGYMEFACKDESP